MLSRRAFQLAQVFAGKMAVRREILGRIIGRAKWSDSAPMEMRLWLEKLGLQPIVPCSLDAMPSAEDRLEGKHVGHRARRLLGREVRRPAAVEQSHHGAEAKAVFPCDEVPSERLADRREP